jgi:hypothetical protein
VFLDEIADEPHGALVGLGRPGRRGDLLGAQRVQVPTLGVVQTQRVRQAVQNDRRRADLVALLQAAVPGRAHAGEEGDLLAAQPGRTAALVDRESDTSRFDAFPPGSQIMTELNVPRALHVPVPPEATPFRAGT